MLSTRKDNMGKQSRANLISELKTAGVRGSLSKMKRSKLMELQQQLAVTDQGTTSHGLEAGQAPDMPPITGGAASEPTKIEQPAPVPQKQKRVRIDPDADDVSAYLSGGSFWGAVDKAGDLTAAAGVAEAATGVGVLETKTFCPLTNVTNGLHHSLELQCDSRHE